MIPLWLLFVSQPHTCASTQPLTLLLLTSISREARHHGETQQQAGSRGPGRPDQEH